MFKWIKNIWYRLTSKQCIVIRNKRLRDTITMLDDLVDREKCDEIATRVLVQTFKSDVLNKYREKYNIPEIVFKTRLEMVQYFTTMLFQQLAVYQPMLSMGRFDILNRKYVELGYVVIPDLLFELIEYGDTPELHERILTDLIHHMDLVRRYRRDLFTKQP